MEFDLGGEVLRPLEDKRTATVGAIQSLTENELAAAEIEGSFDDLLLGPGHDGPFPAVPRASSSPTSPRSSRPRSPRCSSAWVDDLDEKAAARLLAQYVSEYDATYIGWSGGTTLDNTRPTYGSTGRPPGSSSPTSPVPRPTASTSTRIFRDETADYGWE